MTDDGMAIVHGAPDGNQWLEYKGRRWHVDDIHSVMIENHNTKLVQEELKKKGKALTASEKLKRVEAIVNDRAGWELAANQLQSKLVDVVLGPSLPEPLPEYQVVLLENEDDHGHFDYTFCLFWRDNKLIEKGDSDVWKFWASFGGDGNKAKHTCDILNGVFPVI